MSIGLIPAILNGIASLAKQLSDGITGINSNTNTARDNINTTTNAARDNVKAHVTAAVGGVSAVAIKSVQNVVVTGNFVNANGGSGSNSYLDINISAVNPAKAFVAYGRPTVGTSTQFQAIYRIISATVVRCEAYGGGGGNGAVVAFTVVESY